MSQEPIVVSSTMSSNGFLVHFHDDDTVEIECHDETQEFPFVVERHGYRHHVRCEEDFTRLHIRWFGEPSSDQKDAMYATLDESEKILAACKCFHDCNLVVPHY